MSCLLTDEFYMGPVFSSNKQLTSTHYAGQWRSVQTMCGADCVSDERCTFVTAWQNRPYTDYWCAFYNTTFHEEQTQLPYEVDVQKKLFGRSGKCSMSWEYVINIVRSAVADPSTVKYSGVDNVTDLGTVSLLSRRR